MFNSLKSKFFVSFIVIEIIFFSIIAGINFNSLDKASETLTNEKVNITGELLSELLITPLIVYDLATIDNIIHNFSTINNVIAIQVDDPSNTPLSKYVNEDIFPKDTFEALIHNPVRKDNFAVDNYLFSYVDIEVENKTIAHVHFVFDTAETLQSIQKNKNLTYLMIAIALVLGLIISYIIGNNLGKSLERLTNIAQDIAEDRRVIIPYSSTKKDEMDKLFYSMHIMQEIILERTTVLNDSLNNLKQFINALNQSAIVSKTDPNGIITYVNTKFCEVTGYAESELIGKSHSMLKDPEENDNFYAQMWSIITSKKIFKGTFKNIKKSGEPYYVDATIVPLLDNDGNIAEYIAIRYDVTDIVDAKNKALEAKKIKEEFLSNMSHEIRTPMNAILGFVKILQKSISDEKNLSYLNTIESSSQSLLHIINDILDLSKIESGKLSLEQHPFNPEKELKDIVNFFSMTAKENSINLALNIDGKLPKSLKGDITRIKQIIFNLLSNALKFTPKNKSVYVNTKYDHEDNIFYISVIDEGIGISEKAKSVIFNPFEQADNSTTRRFGGTGLGLTISNRLATLMNGKISIDSTEGQGSSFILSIPLEISIQKEKTLPDIDQGLQEKQYTGHILVAEDNKTNQMLIKILLSDYGLTFTIADDGLEAVSEFKKSNFDIVFMDENMPNMTGSEAFEKIIEYEDENKLLHTPVIALTANVMQKDMERFKKLGMDDFLAKPINTEELERVLDRFLTKQV